MHPLFRRALSNAAAKGQPVLIVLAGSNGAGKSTFYRHALQDTGLPFVNADVIAKRMNPQDPGAIAYESMHAAEAERRSLFEARESFVMETVLSDTQGAKLTFFQEARDAGYCLIVIHIWIPSPEISAARVLHRVQTGGHDVPDQKLIERFPRTQANAAMALRMANLGLVYDNSRRDQPYIHQETWLEGSKHPTGATAPTAPRKPRR